MASWTLFEQDFRAVDAVLTELLHRTQALSVHLVDRSGQLVTSVGPECDFDLPTFASLAAADVSANAELGNLFGEQDLDCVVFLGSPRSMASTVIADRVILVVIFDRRSTLGLVRFRSKRAVQALTPVFEALFERMGLVPPKPAPAIPLDLSSLDPEQAFRLEASRRVDELLGGRLEGPGVASDAVMD
jgi:predicted regulator of Ras-like GTPase activity (Roadblock/LC7/MglB family)